MPATVNSERKVLAARVGPALVDVHVGSIDGEGRDGWWLIEAESDYHTPAGSVGLPFKLSLNWSFGNTNSQQILLSVVRGTRITLFARALDVRAANVVGTANPITVRWTPVVAPLPTANVVELRVANLAAGTLSVPVPRFARSVRLGVGDPAAKAGAVLRLIDPFLGGTFDHVTYADQPPDGVLLGDCNEVAVELAAPSNVRLIFGLHL